MDSIKAIIFDMDGLMIDSERLYFDVERALARNYGKEVSDETLMKMMGRSPLEAMSIYAMDLGFDISSEELLRLRNDMFVDRLRNEVSAMKGLYEMLNRFEGKLKMAIATGSPEEFLRIVMDKLKIEKYFDVLQPSDEIKEGKPNPEIYLKAAEKLKVLPSECIVLEDSCNGALAGKRAGCYTIAVPSEYTCKQDFSFVDYIARDLYDAAEHIDFLMNL
ncbi:MAG TPA: HAD family phosphatase [Acetivibrio sp.]|nr:HAD family phosphatase [Clostridium sp.]HOQ37636.1 HAD family phosphatase [Acetivibrio sp.]